MIVVAIIAILAAVAIPNFVKYRKTAQMNACFSNDKYIKVMPKCPATSAEYTLPEGDNDPVCPNPDYAGTDYKHVLPTSAAATPAT